MTSKKRQSVGDSLTLQQLEQRMAALELENNQLKKKLHGGASGKSSTAQRASSPSLTPKQRESLVTGAVSVLMPRVTAKVLERVSRELAKAKTKSEAEEIIKNLSFRINVIYEEVEQDAGLSTRDARRRARSRTRDE